MDKRTNIQLKYYGYNLCVLSESVGQSPEGGGFDLVEQFRERGYRRSGSMTLLICLQNKRRSPFESRLITIKLLT
jgi:hypothetical protein